jgi:beta-galactosidase
MEVNIAGGIETNIAKVETQGMIATVTVLGDGEFRMRCAANNGGINSEIISELKFKGAAKNHIFATPNS